MSEERDIHMIPRIRRPTRQSQHVGLTPPLIDDENGDGQSYEEEPDPGIKLATETPAEDEDEGEG